MAFTGAARVRADTIERFAEKFSVCGFRRESFFPCYGLAEATLMASGGPRQTPPTIVCLRGEGAGAQSGSGSNASRVWLADLRGLRP